VKVFRISIGKFNEIRLWEDDGYGGYKNVVQYNTMYILCISKAVRDKKSID
jgi:hypothetical protein